MESFISESHDGVCAEAHLNLQQWQSQAPLMGSCLFTWQLIPKQPDLQGDGFMVPQLLAGSTHGHHQSFSPTPRFSSLYEVEVLKLCREATPFTSPAHLPITVQLFEPPAEICLVDVHCHIGYCGLTRAATSDLRQVLALQISRFSCPYPSNVLSVSFCRYKEPPKFVTCTHELRAARLPVPKATVSPLSAFRQPLADPRGRPPSLPRAAALKPLHFATKFLL